jgi:hypothetical protein
VEETLRDLAGLNGEEARRALQRGLRRLNQGAGLGPRRGVERRRQILAELGVPEEALTEDKETALLAFVAGRLTAVFKSGESRRCWRRAALIAGHALAGYPMLPKRKQLPEDVRRGFG